MITRRYIILILLLATIMIAGCSSGTSVTTVVPEKAEQPRPIVNKYAFAYYAGGLLAEKEGDYNVALANYTYALKHAPDNGEILYSLADLQYRLGQNQAALDNAEKIYMKDAETYKLIGHCNRELGNHEEALNAYVMAVTLDEWDTEANWYAGTYMKASGRLAEAVTYYERVATVNPTPEIYQAIAEIEISRNNADAAIEDYRESIALAPREVDPGVYLNLASLLRTQGRIDELVQLMLTGLERDPSIHPFRIVLAEMYASEGDTSSAVNQLEWLRVNAADAPAVMNRAGQLALDINRLGLADTMFASELEAEPGSLYGNYYRGRIALFEDRVSDAKQFFKKVVDVADSLPDGYINLGMIYMNQDSVDKAIEILSEGVSKAVTGREEAQYYLCTALGTAERYDEVLSIASPLVRNNPEEVRFLFLLGSALERTQQHDSAAAVFERILEINPNHAPTLNYLGYMWADMGIKLEQSLTMIETALGLDSNNGAYLDSYGWVLYRLGRYEEAESQIRKAIDLTENDDYILYEHLGDVCYALDKHDEARENWLKALEIDPDNPEIRQKLAR